MENRFKDIEKLLNFNNFKMLITILTSIATFIATGFDEIVVLTILFVEIKDKKNIKDVYIGQQISMIVLLLISLLAVFGFAQVPNEWIGLLGFIPLMEGLKVLLDKDNEEEYERKDILKRMKKFDSLTLSIALIAIAGGAEELSAYIPFFASLDGANLIVALIIFMVLVPAWVTICREISNIKHIQDTVEKYERILIPIVFIGLGFFVLIENGTLEMIITFIKNL